MMFYFRVSISQSVRGMEYGLPVLCLDNQLSSRRELGLLQCLLQGIVFIDATFHSKVNMLISCLPHTCNQQ